MSTLLTAIELAKTLGVGVEAIWRWAREGKVPRVKCGRHYRFQVEEVLAALKK